VIRVLFARVKPEKLGRLEAWLAELMQRQEEVRETFVQETVRHEQAFILRGAEGPVLVYVVEAEDHERGKAAYRASQHPIDLEHRRVLEEVLAEKLDLPPLYDCAQGGER